MLILLVEEGMVVGGVGGILTFGVIIPNCPWLHFIHYFKILTFIW